MYGDTRWRSVGQLVAVLLFNVCVGCNNRLRGQADGYSRPKATVI